MFFKEKIYWLRIRGGQSGRKVVLSKSIVTYAKNTQVKVESKKIAVFSSVKVKTSSRIKPLK